MRRKSAPVEREFTITVTTTDPEVEVSELYQQIEFDLSTVVDTDHYWYRVMVEEIK